MKAKHRIINLIILDESGSMESIKNVTITGFNELVQTIKSVEKQFKDQKHSITFITFNGGGIKTLYDNVDVAEMSEINADLYTPNAMTPLYDAMGYGISKIRKETSHLKKYNVLVTVLTDGMENASKEYTGAQIKKMVDELKTKNWTFTYMGTDHNVKASAQNISINNVLFFKKTEDGIKEVFIKESDSRIRFCAKIDKDVYTSQGYYDLVSGKLSEPEKVKKSTNQGKNE